MSVRELFCDVFTLVSQNGIVEKSVVMFPVICQFGTVQISGSGVFLAFNGKHDVVFARVLILLPQLIDVIHIFKAK